DGLRLFMPLLIRTPPLIQSSRGWGRGPESVATFRGPWKGLAIAGRGFHSVSRRLIHDEEIHVSWGLRHCVAGASSGARGRSDRGEQLRSTLNWLMAIGAMALAVTAVLVSRRSGSATAPARHAVRETRPAESLSDFEVVREYPHDKDAYT